MGAALAGPRGLMEEAWRFKQMWGGAMRQTGYMAAACLYALDCHVDRLAADHANARYLAEGLAQLPDVEIDPGSVDTNIVVFSVSDSRRLAQALSDRGMDLLVVDEHRLRAVTYLGISRPDIEDALATITEALAGIRPQV